MPKETDTIDSLFLELSQFTQATTAKELALQAKCEKLTLACAAALQWFETGPADFTRAAEVIVPELEAALSSS